MHIYLQDIYLAKQPLHYTINLLELRLNFLKKVHPNRSADVLIIALAAAVAISESMWNETRL